MRFNLPVRSVAITLLVALAFLPRSALAQSGATPSPRLSDAQIVERLDAITHGLAADDAFSGTVLFAKNGKVLYAHAYGYADRAFDAPNRIDTKFNLASAGKMFTAVSILQLAQGGRLSLDDTLIKHVPDYPNRALASRVTIRQLLTHTAGMGDIFTPEFLASSRAKYRNLAGYVPLFVDKTLLFEPGTRWSYSNAGYLVLGLVIEHVSGQSYYDYVRDHVFKPAGMVDTDNYSVDDVVPNLALGYTTSGDDGGRPDPRNPRRTNTLVLPARGSAAGGGYSTVGDLLRFAQALRGRKLLDAEHTQLLMYGKVVPDSSTPNRTYGFGMTEVTYRGVRIIGHDGAFPGVASSLSMYPELGYTVAVLSNDDGGARSVDNRMRWLLRGQDVPAIVRVNPLVLKTVAGTYATIKPAPGQQPVMPIDTIKVAADTAGLWVAMGPRRRFLPAGTMRFCDREAYNMCMTFMTDRAGAISGLSLATGGPDSLEARRVR